MNQRTIQKDNSWPMALAAILALLIVHVGCSSTKSREATVEPTASATAGVRAPARIESLTVEDNGRSAAIELAADRPLVWTSFRNPEGDLVVELPNSLPAETVADLKRSGLVTSVTVERLEDGERPLTRLVVRTSEPSEHSLSGEGDELRLQLLPIDSAEQVTLAYEPIADDTAPAASASVESETLDEPVTTRMPQATSASSATVASIPQTYGTPEAPQLGPPPAGVIASQLYSVDVLDTSGGTVVQVSGDGEFAFSTFRLKNPERFVIDLNGVVNTGASATVPVGSQDVEQIRIGQFKPRPEAVSRVVFDLRGMTIPNITRSGDGLMVTFGDAMAPEVASAGASRAAAASQAPAPAAAEEPEPEPVELLAEAGGSDAWDSGSAATPEPMKAPPADQSEVATWSAPAPSAPPSKPSIPVYQPPPPASTLGDVAQFEAQSTDVDDKGRTEQERLLESFGPLVVSRQEREYVGEPISMSLKNADLVETLRSFAKISDLNFVIQPGVRGTVTVELKSVPWDQAMEQILKINNLGMDIDGTIVRIAPTSQLRREAEEQRRLSQARQQSIPLRTVMRSLSYATANSMSSLLRSRQGAILSRRGSVQIDNRTNTLIIRELPDNIDTVLAVIETLDTPEPQVTIEAKIVEVTKTFSRTLGIEWGYDFESSQRLGNTTGLQFPNSVDTDGGVGLLTGGANGFLNLSLGNILDTFQLNARLQVAESEGLANVISAPRVTTLNNNAAQIQSGVQLPIQTVSDRTVSVQFVNATLRLAVTPQVTAEGTVILDINVSKRSPQPALAVAGSANVPIATKEARTRVIVRDGGTAVIGGIYEVSTNEGQDRVPGLSNIPILGHLFRNKNRNTSNDELMLFVTPRIVQL